MTCTKTEWDWSAYFAGTLSSALTSELETHLCHCPHCLARYEQWMTAHLDQLEELIGPSSDLTETIMDAIGQPEQRKQILPFSSNRKTWFHYGLAACLALFFFGSGVFTQTVAYSDQSEVLIDQTQQWMAQSKEKADHWFKSVTSGDFIKNIGGKPTHEK